jgi:DNA primase
MVYQKIFLDLQEDEIEFTDPQFQDLYYRIIEGYHQNPELKIDSFMHDLPHELAEQATHILMDEEKYGLHQWDRKLIFVKEKKDNVAQVVNETILNLRRHLVTKKIDELSAQFSQEDNSTAGQEALQSVTDYIGLKKILSEKLNRVL